MKGEPALWLTTEVQEGAALVLNFEITFW